MIGSRLVAAAAVLALVIGLGGGAPRPDVELAGEHAVLAAADRTLMAIERLQAALSGAVDAGRLGAARVVAGAADPTEPLLSSAATITAAGPAALELREARAALERARAAFQPDADPLPEAPDPADLASIAAQLDQSAEAGATFAAMRREVEGVSATLVEALDEVAGGDLGAARSRLFAASAAVDELRAWQEQASTLPVWIRTASAMIRAMHQLVDAVEGSDAAKARDARADFDAVAERAPQADRALRIGIGEAGSALTSVPLRRLADVLRGLDELRVAVDAARSEAGA